MTVQYIAPNAALAATTINAHIRKIVERPVQEDRFLGALKKKGKIEYNASSYAFDWLVDILRRSVTWSAPDDPVSSPQYNRHKRATLPYRKCHMSEGFSKFTELANRGPEAQAKIIATAVKNMAVDCVKSLSAACWVDGNASGYTNQIHGLQSFTGNDGAVQSASSLGFCGPSDTYANLNTGIGYYGGSATDFPIGTCASHAIFWSPLLADIGSTWYGTTATWAAQWRSIMSACNLYMRVHNDERPDVYYMTPAMYRTVNDSLTASEQININRGKESLMASLGYETITFEGIDLIDEINCPSGTAWGVNFDHLTLRSMQSQLFEKTDSRDDTVSTKNVTFDFYGNLVADSPRFFIEIADHI